MLGVHVSVDGSNRDGLRFAAIAFGGGYMPSIQLVLGLLLNWFKDRGSLIKPDEDPSLNPLQPFVNLNHCSRAHVSQPAM